MERFPILTERLLLQIILLLSGEFLSIVCAAAFPLCSDPFMTKTFIINEHARW